MPGARPRRSGPLPGNKCLIPVSKTSVIGRLGGFSNNASRALSTSYAAIAVVDLAELRDSSSGLFHYAVLFADIAGAWSLWQINKFAVKILCRRVRELNIRDSGRAECASDGAFGQTVHLHMTLAKTQCILNPGADTKNVADSNHSG